MLLHLPTLRWLIHPASKAQFKCASSPTLIFRAQVKPGILDQYLQLRVSFKGRNKLNHATNQGSSAMESCIDAMSSEYDEFVAAAADILDATKASGGGGGGRPRNEALDKFKQRWQLLMASCDRAEEVVDSARRRIMAENVMDMASGVAPGGPAAAVTPPVRVPRLERALHATSSLAADLRHAAGAAGGSVSAHKAE